MIEFSCLAVTAMVIGCSWEGGGVLISDLPIQKDLSVQSLRHRRSLLLIVWRRRSLAAGFIQGCLGFLSPALKVDYFSCAHFWFVELGGCVCVFV